MYLCLSFSVLLYTGCQLGNNHYKRNVYLYHICAYEIRLEKCKLQKLKNHIFSSLLKNIYMKKIRMCPK